MYTISAICVVYTLNCYQYYSRELAKNYVLNTGLHIVNFNFLIFRERSLSMFVEMTLKSANH